MATKNRTYHEESRLVARTRELLRASNKTQLEIYNDTKIQPNWLAQFSAGSILNPSANRTEALYNYLRGSPLEVE
jgi:hypothetical protein